MALVDLPDRRRRYGEGRAETEYLSRERVVGPDPDKPGRTCLLYLPGDPIPYEEAVRQGLVAERAGGEKALGEAEAEDKALRGVANKSGRRGPRRKTRGE